MKPYKVKNQIDKRSNKITLYAGDKSKSNMMKDQRYQWEIEEAFIMNESERPGFDEIDIGMAVIAPDKRLFDRLLLKQKVELNKAKRIPACLAAKNHDAKAKTLLGAGWGADYDQEPSINPLYSSCMSSEAGPEDWRFQNCEIRGSKNICNKNTPPPGYDKVTCDKYFDKALSIVGRGIADIDVMYITKEKDGAQTTEHTCYQPKLFSEHGWCLLEWRNKLLGNPWGICSPSCSTKAMKEVRLYHCDLNSNYFMFKINFSSSL